MKERKLIMTSKNHWYNKYKTHLRTGLALVLGFVAYKAWTHRVITPTNNEDLARTSVMITNYEQSSGGTGVILRSTSTKSYILTNAHVCGVIEHGGLVQSERVKASVVNYKVSENHDLCLITANADFQASTVVASTPPSSHSEASVVGHPILLPNIITRGNFSNHLMIPVMYGFRKCTEEDVKNGENIILCAILGGIPQIKVFEAQSVGATIMPGSSGSAVFNTSGEIAGLVFAGQGELSYGFIVPQEYVYDFVNNEAETLKAKIPDTSFEFSFGRQRGRLREVCTSINSGLYTADVVATIKPYCKYLKRDMLKN